MKLSVLFIWMMLFILTNISIASTDKQSENESLLVRKCQDFSFTGEGINPEWDKASWHQLSKLDPGGNEYKSKFKIMYSTTGIYLLFYGRDNQITTTFNKDFDDLFKGDVFEVFFHPDKKTPLYIEYEINQLEKELILIIPNLNGKFYGWVPWHYENERRVIKKISVEGGSMETGSKIKSWSAELFFSYQLFSPLSNVPPISGTRWNANFYRLDYDSGKMIKWAWSPIKQSFHEFEKYGTIQFE